MVLALTWLGWSVLLTSVGVIVSLWARHARRAAVGEELARYLAHALPDIAIVEVRGGSMRYQSREGGMAPRTLALDSFYRQLAACPGGTAEAEAARREVFATVAITMRARVGRAPADDPAALLRAS